jgi:hypothetical protein
MTTSEEVSSPDGASPATATDPHSNSGGSSTPKELKWTIWAVSLALLLVPIYSLGSADVTDGLSVLAVGLALALSALMGGALLGFLFAIPRSASSARSDTDSENGAGYRSNTNLEQISDWLTKILVGVGLTQIGNIPSGVGRLISATRPGLGGGDGDEVFAGTLLTLFTICGFLAGYILTRVHLPKAFAVADRRAIEKVARTEARRQTANVVRDVEERLGERATHDAQALALVDQVLRPTPGVPAVSQEELEKALSNASPPVQVQIFFLAREHRRAANWRTEEGRSIVERAVPLLHGLLKTKPPVPEHRLFGQLGFAVKDTATNPSEYAEAERLLSRAIALREAAKEPGYLLYEFNRAECLIRQDTDFVSHLPTEAIRRDAILRDLRVAAGSEALHRIICSDEPFTTWLQLNSVLCEQLV